MKSVNKLIEIGIHLKGDGAESRTVGGDTTIFTKATSQKTIKR